MARTPSCSPSPVTPTSISSSPSLSFESNHSDRAPNSDADGLPNFDTQDSLTCEWDGCGLVFIHLPTLIDHIHNEHIGVHKPNYTCEWATCSRRGLPQTSRFALISHIRSHTGEKPFTCPRPECDKSFTRSDALAKHMRLLHNISPPSLGKGNRKRKRATSVAISEANNDADASSTIGGPAPYSAFKIEPGSSEDPEDGGFGNESAFGGEGFINGNNPDPKLAKDEDSDEDESLPAHLLAIQDPVTGLIMGRSPSMVRYLLMKAKHRYALEQHGSLIEELRVVRWELRREQLEKERALDEVLKVNIGPQAEVLVPSH